jgi:hypothetical protein
MRAISIRQPWAWAIMSGLKDIENRSWKTDFRGDVLVHASKKPDDMEAFNFVEQQVEAKNPKSIFILPRNAVDYGGIIGIVEIVDCVSKSSSPWFFGPYGFVLRNPRPLPFQSCRGMLGFFTPGAEWTPPDYLDGRGPRTDAERLS